MKITQYFTRQHLYSARYFITCTFIMAVLLWWFGVNLIIAGAYSTAVTAAGIVVAEEFMKSLHKRIEATDGISWDIEINRIKVGEIADNQYATIVLSNFSNSRVLWAQCA